MRQLNLYTIFLLLRSTDIENKQKPTKNVKYDVRCFFTLIVML